MQVETESKTFTKMIFTVIETSYIVSAALLVSLMLNLQITSICCLINFSQNIQQLLGCSLGSALRKGRISMGPLGNMFHGNP